MEVGALTCVYLVRMAVHNACVLLASHCWMIAGRVGFPLPVVRRTLRVLQQGAKTASLKVGFVMARLIA